MPKWSRGRGALLIALLGTDALAVGFGYLVAYLLRFETASPLFDPQGVPNFLLYTRLAFTLIPLSLIVFALSRLYDSAVLFVGWQEYMRVFNATTISITLVIAVAFINTELVIARGWLLLSWVLVTASVTASRFTMRRVVQVMRRRGYLTASAIVVGANGEGVSIARQLLDASGAGVRVVGFLDNEQPIGAEVLPGLRVLARTTDLGAVLARHEITELMVATSALHRLELVDLVQQQWTHSRAVNVHLSTGLYEILTTGVEVRNIGYVPFLDVNQLRLTGVDVVIKRALDIVFACLGLLMLSLVMPLIAFIIRNDSPGPIFYRRRVVGVGGREFDAFKFRTMVTNGDEVLEAYFKVHPEERETYEREIKLKTDPRVTRIGRFLRKTSMDELPQLVNVLKGEMSIVGPRMITAPELAHYTQWAMNLLTVKPGITGLWQVSGRSDVTYEERVRLDMWYIRNWSIWLDIQIVFQTFAVVLLRKGAY
ncbi:MAG: sugar transferase [Anaerolineae bacterium]|nr:sugar transferase [Anaerolineae bacterium]